MKVGDVVVVKDLVAGWGGVQQWEPCVVLAMRWSSLYQETMVRVQRKWGVPVEIPKFLLQLVRAAELTPLQAEVVYAVGGAV